MNYYAKKLEILLAQPKNKSRLLELSVGLDNPITMGHIRSLSFQFLVQFWGGVGITDPHWKEWSQVKKVRDALSKGRKVRFFDEIWQESDGVINKTYIKLRGRKEKRFYF